MRRWLAWHIPVLLTLGTWVHLICNWSGPRSQFRGAPATYMHSLHTRSGAKGEGWRSARWPPGVEEDRKHSCTRPSTKHAGPMPPRAFRGNPANIKRSYKRACTRASRHGHTWYKGRIMTCQQLQCPPPTVCPRSLTPHDPVVHRPPKLRNRLNIFSWNPSGLARHRLTELLVWLQAQPVHVVVLQETRWHQNWEGR